MILRFVEQEYEAPAGAARCNSNIRGTHVEGIACHLFSIKRIKRSVVMYVRSRSLRDTCPGLTACPLQGSNRRAPLGRLSVPSRQCLRAADTRLASRGLVTRQVVSKDTCMPIR